VSDPLEFSYAGSKIAAINLTGDYNSTIKDGAAVGTLLSDIQDGTISRTPEQTVQMLGEYMEHLANLKQWHAQHKSGWEALSDLAEQLNRQLDELDSQFEF